MIALELKSTSIILLVLTCQISCEDDESQNVYEEFSNLVKQLTAKVDDQRDLTNSIVSLQPPSLRNYGYLHHIFGGYIPTSIKGTSSSVMLRLHY